MGHEKLVKITGLMCESVREVKEVESGVCEAPYKLARGPEREREGGTRARKGARWCVMAQRGEAQRKNRGKPKPNDRLRTHEGRG